MGCGCKERGRILASAARRVVLGGGVGAAQRAKVVVASAAHSARQHLPTLRFAARTRPHGKAR